MSDAGFMAAGERLLRLESRTHASAAYVYYNGRRYLAGEAGQDLVRIYPRLVSDGCWDQLSLRPSEITAAARTPAFSELAYHHLSHVWTQVTAKQSPVATVALALPAYMLRGSEADEKVGLLLGMAQDLQIPLCSLVDLGACALAEHVAENQRSERDVIVADMHQRCLEVSRYHVGQSLQRLNTARISDLGYGAFLGDVIPRLANRFLSQTSFDVSHDAETEQEFFNQALLLIRRLAEAPESAIELYNLKRPRKMAISADALTRLTDTFASRLAETIHARVREFGGEEAHDLVISERVARIPGLEAKLRLIPRSQLFILTEGAAARGAARFAENSAVVSDLAETPTVENPSLHDFGITVPRQAPGESPENGPTAVPDAVNAPRPGDSPMATHLAHRGRAFPLGSDSDFTIGGEDSPFSDLPEDFPTCEIVRDGETWRLPESIPEQFTLDGDAVSGGEVIAAGSVLAYRDGAVREQFLALAVMD